MRPTIVLAGGFVLAAFVALLVYQASQPAPPPPSPAAAAPATQPVVVAAADMALGTTVDAASLKLVEWPMSHLPEGVYATPETLVGRVTLSRFAVNEPVTSDRLAPIGTRGLLPLVIEPGMRAVTVRVNEVSAVSGFIVPGSRVDILLTGTVTVPAEVSTGSVTGQTDVQNVPQHRTRTLLSNVTVVAMGRMLEGGDPKTADNITTATLLLSPDDSELLTLASNEGTLQLALRNFADMAPIASFGKSTPDLYALGATAGLDQVSEIDNVEVIRGADRLTMAFQRARPGVVE